MFVSFSPKFRLLISMCRLAHFKSQSDILAEKSNSPTRADLFNSLLEQLTVFDESMAV